MSVAGTAQAPRSACPGFEGSATTWSRPVSTANQSGDPYAIRSDPIPGDVDVHGLAGSCSRGEVALCVCRYLAGVDELLLTAEADHHRQLLPRHLGRTTGFGMGGELQPWICPAGKAAFTQGVVNILVGVDGTFEWGRRAGKPVSVYAQTPYGSLRRADVLHTRSRHQPGEYGGHRHLPATCTHEGLLECEDSRRLSALQHGDDRRAPRLSSSAISDGRPPGFIAGQELIT